MNKLRLSHSLIEAWERGNPDDVVTMYFHLEAKTNKAMEDGRRIHEEIAEHVDTYNTFPDWFFDKELRLPETEKEVIVEYNEMFNLKCIIDCLDIPLLYEFKTGGSESLEWARTNQLPLYFLACEIAKIPVESAYLIHHNQHIKKTDFTIVHNSASLREKARNVIDSTGPEIYEFFSREGLI